MTSDADAIERAISETKAGRGEVSSMLEMLLAGTLAVPSGGEVAADGAGFRPVLFDKDGTPMVAVFTAKERIGEFGAMAPYALEMPARAFFARVPDGHGVVVNPGQEAGFEIDPAGLSRLLQRDTAS